MKAQTVSTKVVQLDSEDKVQVETVARLHMTLLPESLLSELGFSFLSKFYYKLLPQSGLIDVFLYKNGTSYVGFIACTAEPLSFMNKGMKRNPFSLGMVLLTSFIAKPKRIAALLGMGGGIDLRQTDKEYGPGVGQFMSFGVLPEMRRVVDDETGLSISNVLMKQVFHYFKLIGKNRFFLLVLKSNQTAIKFYERYNGYLVKGGNEKSDIYMFNAEK